jgi:hypothetical protein
MCVPIAGKKNKGDKMKTLIILLLTLTLTGCYTTSNVQYPWIPMPKVIKFQKFGKIEYDWYDAIKITGNHTLYIKNTVLGSKTNYVKSDFELITYDQYLEETE